MGFLVAAAFSAVVHAHVLPALYSFGAFALQFWEGLLLGKGRPLAAMEPALLPACKIPSTIQGDRCAGSTMLSCGPHCSLGRHTVRNLKLAVDDSKPGLEYARGNPAQLTHHLQYLPPNVS